jgi:hypothetical protein
MTWGYTEHVLHLFEFTDDGRALLVTIDSVQYILSDNAVTKTLICLKDGTKLYVDQDYQEVKRLLTLA